MSTATAAGIRGRENLRSRFTVSVPSSAAVVVFDSPVHAGRTATNTHDFASGLAVAGDDPVNETDPSGDFTLGWCVESEAALGLGSFGPGVTNTGAVCLTRTVFVPNGTDDIGLTETLGNLDGHTLGADLSAGIDIQVSNADNLHELGGNFNNINIGFGGAPGPGANGSYFSGTASDGRQIYGVDVGFNLGVGASVGKFSTDTWVQQANNPFLANGLRGVWNTVSFGIYAGLVEIGQLIDDSITAFASQPPGPSASGCPTGSG